MGLDFRPRLTNPFKKHPLTDNQGHAAVTAIGGAVGTAISPGVGTLVGAGAGLVIGAGFRALKDTFEIF